MAKIFIENDVTVELIDSMGGDMSIVQAARVSVKGENSEYDVEGSAGLINYLMKERHGSPFEHVTFKFYVKAPIFVFREFHRHRIASYNEISGRYAKLEPDFYIPSGDRPLVNSGSSARPEFEQTDGNATKLLHSVVDSELEYAYQVAWESYIRMLDAGVANEVARMCLPVGIFSEMYVTMNLRSLFNFLSLRTKRKDARHVSRPQREIEMVAEKMEIDIMNSCPVAHEAFNKHGRVAP